MKAKIKIIIIGPFPEPISGVSLSNKKVKDIFVSHKKFSPSHINMTFPIFEERLGNFTFKKFFYFFILNLNSYKIFRVSKVYMTPGQTFFGILKYAPFIILSWLLNKELIIHVHGDYLKQQYKLLRGVRKLFFRFLITRFDKGIVLSDSLKSNLSPFLKNESIFSLPNFAEEFLYKKNNIIKDTNKIRIIFLSNLMREKGIIQLLRVLVSFENAKIEYEAKIAGNIDKESKEVVLKLLRTLKNTEYLGVVNGERKKKLLLWGNVFVLPTYYKMEGQPISIIEAMATTNAIITTKHAGIPDIIKNNINGFFVKKRDTQDLREKLVYAINNKDEILKIMNYNRNFFLSNFTFNKFRDEIIEIINK
jgi:glycosyltransferase involved in cell wall biosynthesis